MSSPPSPPLLLPPRLRDSHKGDYGRVLCVGGSRGMSGSISLTAMAALRCGSGLVTVMVPDRCLETVAGFDPCLMTLPAADTDRGRFADAAVKSLDEALQSIKPHVIAAGPGMRVESGSNALVRRLGQFEECPRVLDADGLNNLAELRSEGSGNASSLIRGLAVLTPHPGELSRLTGVSPSDREAQLEAASSLADELGAIVLLKGADTLITDGRRRHFNTTGTPGMASGGTGDCLTGIIASLLGQRLSAWDAAVLGAYVHGRAGQLAADALGEAGMTAVDLLHHLPAAVAEVVSPRP